VSGTPLQRVGLALAVVVTLGTRLTLALSDPRALIAADVFQDDAFYYLTIARNLIQGAGLTFDQQIPTNAFHPVYLAMLLPVQWLSGPDVWSPIRAAALLLTGVATATTPLLFALTRRLAGASAAVFVAMAFAFSPQMTTLGVNGLETGPAFFMGLLLAWLYVRWFFPRPIPNARRAVVFGAVGGLAVLTRVDLALWLGALGIDWLRRVRPIAWTNRSQRRTLLLVVSGTALVWLPWAFTSGWLTGAVLPTSGAASREIAHNLGWGNLAASFGGASGVAFDPRFIPRTWRADVAAKAVYIWLFEQPLLFPLRYGVDYGVWPALSGYAPYRVFLYSPWLGLATLAAAATACRAGFRRAAGPTRDGSSLAFPITLYCVALFTGYVFLAPSHWYFSRYLAFSVWLVTVGALAPITRASQRHATRLPARFAIATGAILLVMVQASQLADFRMRPVWGRPQGRGFLTSWEAMRDQIPSGARIGAFQAGIYGWFSDTPVRNLDGKVNRDAQRALANQQLHEYILASDVDYILDQPRMTRALLLRHSAVETRARFIPVASERRRQGATLYRIERGPSPP